VAQAPVPGQIVILNGTPRCGKSSIAAVIQDTFDGVWMNLGVDGFMRMTPGRYMPGMGLRPGGERQDLEPLVQTLYRALYESIAAHNRLGLNVVVDVGHHDSYAVPRGILPDCARLLSGLPVLFVGVRCPLETILERRSKQAGLQVVHPTHRYHGPCVCGNGRSTSLASTTWKSIPRCWVRRPARQQFASTSITARHPRPSSTSQPW
jgi:chloramphenicol 3-O-phosphotransferase